MSAPLQFIQTGASSAARFWMNLLHCMMSLRSDAIPIVMPSSNRTNLSRNTDDAMSLPYVIIRPGAVFGPGKSAITGRVGINTFGFFIHLGGGNVLPLTYVDNCAEAIVMAGIKPGIEGEVFNVVDDDLPTSNRSSFEPTREGSVASLFGCRIPSPIWVAWCGRNIPNGRAISFRQFLIAGAAFPNGAVIAIPIES